MGQSPSKELIESHLAGSGVKFNGPNPWDIQVNDERLYDRIVKERSLGVGEAYMEGWFDAAQLDETISRITRVYSNYVPKFRDMWMTLQAIVLNKQSRKRAYQVGEKHYDTGNDLFELMLDKRMVYSCAYWRNAKTLDEAQEAKLDLICRKLYLKPGQCVLDIGCGWGSFAKFAVERYDVRVVGITVSQEQKELADEMCRDLPIEIRFQDYRALRGEQFDRIVSIGQMEHVGYKNYLTSMRICHDCLKDDGLFLLHTIGNTVNRKKGEPWIEKYIFPNGMVPSIQQLAEAFQGLFVMEDWHNFSADYDKTLMAWNENFEKAWPKLKEKYDERFYRMWRYYLLSCAGAFRARQLQLWQVVFSKNGVIGGYESIR